MAGQVLEQERRGRDGRHRAGLVCEWEGDVKDLPVEDRHRTGLGREAIGHWAAAHGQSSMRREQASQKIS